MKFKQRTRKKEPIIKNRVRYSQTFNTKTNKRKSIIKKRAR